MCHAEISDSDGGDGGDESKERMLHYGMTKADFDWVQSTWSLIQQELAGRRGHELNVRNVLSYCTSSTRINV
jgi:hypothetical protein